MTFFPVEQYFVCHRVWRNLHDEEVNGLYLSPNIVWEKKSRMKWIGQVVLMGERRGVYRVLVWRPE
jgi:hypothetical protein